MSAVDETARQLAAKFGAGEDVVVAAAMLCDIADAVMAREDPRHEQESMTIATSYLRVSGFTESEIVIIIDDAIKNHSCLDERSPETLEGKVLATAEAMVDLRSDFYDFAIGQLRAQGETARDILHWGLERVDRDFNKKILFPEVKEGLRPDYERSRRRFADLK
ncbi:MAG: hypothetical protein KBD06_01845 [Candidatus Pacebacteria bacterium]|nr:hypothetical protein [Candidatus Paceibacterota bacterium]